MYAIGLLHTNFALDWAKLVWKEGKAFFCFRPGKEIVKCLIYCLTQPTYEIMMCLAYVCVKASVLLSQVKIRGEEGQAYCVSGTL